MQAHRAAGNELPRKTATWGTSHRRRRS